MLNTRLGKKLQKMVVRIHFVVFSFESLIFSRFFVQSMQHLCILSHFYDVLFLLRKSSEENLKKIVKSRDAYPHHVVSSVLG